MPGEGEQERGPSSRPLEREQVGLQRPREDSQAPLCLERKRMGKGVWWQKGKGHSGGLSCLYRVEGGDVC